MLMGTLSSDRLTHSVQDKWQKQVHPESSLSNQIGRLRSELLSLAHLDNELFKNLLALNDKLEELKLQRGSGIKEPPILQEALSEETTDEYDDDDIGKILGRLRDDVPTILHFK